VEVEVGEGIDAIALLCTFCTIFTVTWLWCGGAKRWDGGYKPRWRFSTLAPPHFNHCNKHEYSHTLSTWEMYRSYSVKMCKHSLCPPDVMTTLLI